MMEGTSENPNAKYLIDLIINQDHVAQNWIKFLLGIESALAVAHWILAKSAAEACAFHGFGLVALSILTPFFGIAAAVTITKIVVHERKWQAWYVNRFVELSQSPDSVFPSKPGLVRGQPEGYISSVLRNLSAVVVGGWSLAAFVGITAAIVLIHSGECH
jgi:hypothetical protein